MPANDGLDERHLLLNTQDVHRTLREDPGLATLASAMPLHRSQLGHRRGIGIMPNKPVNLHHGDVILFP